MAPGLHIEGGQIALADGDRRFLLTIDQLHLSPGRAVALTGASGSGKTLVLELLGLLRPPGVGTRYGWQGTGPGDYTDLAALWQGGVRSKPLAETRGRLFGFVPQSGGLMPFLSVAENIALPQKLTKREDAAWCAALIDRLGLTEVAELMPGPLSIGQRQRTAIARALAHRPPFVIADEPTAALDPVSADRVLALLLETATDQGCGVILSSHDLDRIAGFGIPAMRLVTGPVTGAVTGADAAGGTHTRLEPAPC